jgi:hypothetical protein
MGYYVLGGIFVPVSLFFLNFGVPSDSRLFFDVGNRFQPVAALAIGPFFTAIDMAVSSVRAGIGLFAFAIGIAMAALTVYCGRCIAQRKNLTFVYILAGILCTNMPLGTLLGVLTFVVLSNDHTKSLFNARAS